MKDTQKMKLYRYRGFLLVQCQNCGDIHGFYIKEPMGFYRCGKCAHIMPLGKMHWANVRCECGNRIDYRTNMKEAMMDIPCISCGNPVAVAWNEKKTAYQTILE